MRLVAIVAVLSVSVAFAADLAEKWQKRIDTAQAAYTEAVTKADNAYFYAKQKANVDRLKVLRTVLTDATKAGDFDAAMVAKALITSAEEAGTGRPKPKNVIKFGGHEYALIEDKATWHVAKRLCEEMGGHLATVNSPEENARLLAICKSSKAEAWIGATDEAVEGEWKWVDGSRITMEIHQDNRNDIQHYLVFHGMLGTWDDGDGGLRTSYLCEWDN